MTDNVPPQSSSGNIDARLSLHDLANAGGALYLGNPEYDRLARVLRKFDVEAVVATVAGLLTVPEYQSATIRLEILLHLAVLHCKGHTVPRRPDIARWLQVILAESLVRRWEDPIEDVFISNVTTPAGNIRLFEGNWEASDVILQDLLNCLLGDWMQPYHEAVSSITSLLFVSDLVVERAGLSRWATSEQHFPRDVFLTPAPNLQNLRGRVTLSRDTLRAYGISPSALRPFLFPQNRREALKDETLGHTTLERFPLIPLQDHVILACPAAVSPAIRRFLLEWATANGLLNKLQSALRVSQRRRVFEESLTLLAAPNKYVKVLLPDGISAPPTGVLIDSVVAAVDTDKLAYVGLLHDDLTKVHQEGISSTATLSKEQEKQFQAHLVESITQLSQRARGGLVVIVGGGLGRGGGMTLPRLPSGWYSVAIRAADFNHLAWTPEASLLRIWKLLEDKGRLAGEGVRIFDVNGIINTYAFWQAQEFNLVPRNSQFGDRPTMVSIASNFVYDLRLHSRRANDYHAAPLTASGPALPICRLTRSSYFPAMLNRPIYVAPEALRDGALLGCIESTVGTVWLLADTDNKTAPSAFIYQFWEATLSWLDRILTQIAHELCLPTNNGGYGVGNRRNDEKRNTLLSTTAFRIYLQLEPDPSWATLTAPAQDAPIEALEPNIDRDEGTITLKLPVTILRLLQRPTNDGERALLEGMTFGLLPLLEKAGKLRLPLPTDPTALRVISHSITKSVLGGTDARSIHLFEAETPMDRIAGAEVRKPPQLIQPEDRERWQRGLAWRALDRATFAADFQENLEPDRTPSVTLTGEQRVGKVLNEIVDAIWQQLQSELKNLDGLSLIQFALDRQEAVLRDRMQWNRTARAVTALYGAEDDVDHIAGERESMRAEAINAIRVLVEMATCTCPQSGGRAASWAVVDWLLAGVSLLQAVAADSDAVHTGLASPQMAILPDGRVQTDHSFVAAVVNPFLLETLRDQFHEAAAAYDLLYRPRRMRSPAPMEPSISALSGSESLSQTMARTERLASRRGEAEDENIVRPPKASFDAAFTTAFVAEYQITPDRLVDGFAELVALGQEAEALVVTTTRGVLTERLHVNRHFTEAESEAFFQMIGLVPRPDWEKAPSGYRFQDIAPWRFRRRLSLVARPVVMFGIEHTAPVLYGLGHLGASLSYILENIQAAWLPNEYFTSPEMRRYRGTVADQQGHAFETEIAEAVRKAGWEAKAGILMSSLGAEAMLGDLDVVAWRPDERRLLLIECKRLQPARTVGEIAELLRRFRGDSQDALARHLRRATWVAENLTAVRAWLGLPKNVEIVETIPLLVSNIKVPMRFISGLPIPSGHIIAHRDLRSWLATNA